MGVNLTRIHELMAIPYAIAWHQLSSAQWKYILEALPGGMKHHRVNTIAGHLSSVVDGQA